MGSNFSPGRVLAWGFRCRPMRARGFAIVSCERCCLRIIDMLLKHVTYSIVTHGPRRPFGFRDSLAEAGMSPGHRRRADRSASSLAVSPANAGVAALRA